MMQGRRSSFFYLLPQQSEQEGRCERDCEDRKLQHRAWLPLYWVAACRQMVSADVMAVTK
jgi:hypothetical protein